MTQLAWIGGYTSEAGGNARGIGVLERRPDSSGTPRQRYRSVTEAASPSWLAAHPRLPVLYAALEHAGEVGGFRPGLLPAGRLPIGPALCHVLVAGDGSHLIACCWGDGTVARVGLDDAGGLTTVETAVASTDPWAPAGSRQSRAHCAVPLGDDLVLTSDLGHDTLRLFDVSQGLEELAATPLPQGSGPRHLVAHSGSRVSVITEYGCTVLTLQRTGHRFEVVGQVPLLAGAVPEGAAAAELAASADGRVLYAAVRGPDVLVTLAADDLTVLDRRRSGARWPRHHRRIGDRLLVAHERSDEITVHAVDPATGVPAGIVDRVPAPTPSCILA